MSAFQRSRQTAQRSIDLLRPFLEEKTAGRYVFTEQGRQSEAFQKLFGDLIANFRANVMHIVECKAEERYTGNVFLELWSNFNIAAEPGLHYFSHGPTPGWLTKVHADLLFYHFIDVDKLFVFKLPELQRWAFLGETKRMSDPDLTGVRHQMQGRVFDFRVVPQTKSDQRNLTLGALVPIRVLKKELGAAMKETSVKQMTLDLFGGKE